MKLHIKKKHGGLGQPVRIHGRGKSVFNEQNLPKSDNSGLRKLMNENPQLDEFHYFDRNDVREIELAKKLKSIVPQFLELDRLLKSQNYSEQHFRIFIAKTVISAVESPNPSDYMNEILSIFKNMFSIDRMLFCLSAYMKINIKEVKNSLK